MHVNHVTFCRSSVSVVRKTSSWSALLHSFLLPVSNYTHTLSASILLVGQHKGHLLLLLQMYWL